MRGVKSFAMVLAVSIGTYCTPNSSFYLFVKATSKEGKDKGIELIQPPANSKPGDKIYFEGPDYESTRNQML